MKQVIWKEPLLNADTQLINVPEGAELIHAAEQNGAPFVWFRCDPTAAIGLRTPGGSALPSECTR